MHSEFFAILLSTTICLLSIYVASSRAIWYIRKITYKFKPRNVKNDSDHENKGTVTNSCCLAIGHFLRLKCMLSVRISLNWCPKWPHRIHLKLRIDIFYCSLIINDYGFLTAAKGQHSFSRKHNRNLDFIKIKQKLTNEFHTEKHWNSNEFWILITNTNKNNILQRQKLILGKKSLPQTSNHPSTRLGYLISQTRFTTRRPMFDEKISKLLALYINTIAEFLWWWVKYVGNQILFPVLEYSQIKFSTANSL